MLAECLARRGDAGAGLAARHSLCDSFSGDGGAHGGCDAAQDHPGGGRAAEDALAATLGWPHLLALGVGAIVGTGILTLIGVGADRAGPAVLVSFGIAGLVCACAALCYAELAAMMPQSGSAYSYSYSVLGEIFAWIVGWALILEYSLVVSTVAVGWSGYATPLLTGIGFPVALTQGPELGGIVNLPAIFIIAVVTGAAADRHRARARGSTPCWWW